ncbi:hypothetical protein [Kosmotoga pacifica]|nr:hypothetical protein [Kosmotoga pacifica]
MSKGQTSMTMILGLILIVVGVVFIFLPQFSSNFWLLFVWLPGIIMEEEGLRNRIPGLLVPAGILLTVAAVLTLEVLFPGFSGAGGWAFYIFAPAFGLLQMYLAKGKRNNSLLFPIGLLSILTAAFLLFNFTNLDTGMVFGIILIAFGVFMLFRRRK